MTFPLKKTLSANQNITSLWLAPGKNLRKRRLICKKSFIIYSSNMYKVKACLCFIQVTTRFFIASTALFSVALGGNLTSGLLADYPALSVDRAGGGNPLYAEDTPNQEFLIWCTPIQEFLIRCTPIQEFLNWCVTNQVCISSCML